MQVRRTPCVESAIQSACARFEGLERAPGQRFVPGQTAEKTRKDASAMRSMARRAKLPLQAMGDFSVPIQAGYRRL